MEEDKMNKNIKTIFFIILVIIIITVIAIFGYNILNKNENVNETQSSINETNPNTKIEVNETENNIVNETQNNVIENEVENKQTENKIENTTTQNVVTNETTEVLQNNGASNEEKAINIVKNDWGTTENVYFVTMGIDASGKYIVTVNDSSTTATLAWYLVDVATGKFDIQQ